jgi:FixJ family two-component response regulator
MLTGAGNQEIEMQALRTGAADYLRKEQIKMKGFKVAIDNAFAQQSSKRQH